MPVTKGNLKPRDEQRIRKNYDNILREVDAKEVAPALFTKGVITKDELDDIMNEINGKLNRNGHLLNLILNSGPEDSFRLYLEALQEKYGHVKEWLEKNEYDWYENIDQPIKQHVITQNDAERMASFLSDKWETIMIFLGLTKTEIDECKRWTAGADRAKVDLLKCWASRERANVNNFMTCLIQVVENSGECPAINWEGLEECIKAIDPAAVDPAALDEDDQGMELL